MELFGIGPLELIFIILLALVIFGPKDLQKAGKTMGKWLYKLTQSDMWKTITQASKKLKTLPGELVREAGVEELQQAVAPLQSDLQKVKQAGHKVVDTRLGESWLVEPDDAVKEIPSMPKEETIK
jgi:Sec-independent protein translocase protein TatA